MTSIEAFKASCVQDGLLPCGFIGSGNMAMAIATGIIKSQLFVGSDIMISGSSGNSFKRWDHLGVHSTLDNKGLVQKCKIIFLCVKPNALESVTSNLKDLDNQTGKDYSKQTIVSILAGTMLHTLKYKLGFLKNINFVRAMPNTPLNVCAGATALTPRESDSIESKNNFAVVRNIFEKSGIVEIVGESKFHAITGLSGSGPAYIYIIIEALSDAGVKQGLPRDLALKFAAQTVYGASKNLIETGIHPGQAKDQVTSAGGTTIYGVHELEKGRLRDTLINAVEAATKRSQELDKEAASEAFMNSVSTAFKK